MRIATWNVNSLTAERLVRIWEWLDVVQPDILCLQETKVTDAAFPALDLHARGYASVHHGQGRWNGVAIVSRVGLDDPVSGFGDGAPLDDEARLVSATCDGVRVSSVYVPNGREVGHDQFHHKLRWLGRLRAHVEAETALYGAAAGIAVCGDFNVAPEDIDVWNPKAVHGATHVTPEERAALGELEAFGLRDAFREQYPGEPNLFSWWDYRAGAFHKHQGMRIDL
ncbi:MAG TPA: exodeoxyribonuclease III, partial [Acidimicrobiales bacterium]|nr:exodeoxyribonuclease III [Acidimicrobiales bacterium]